MSDIEPTHIAETVAPVRVGFTGTRDGMTDAQKATVADLLERVAPRWCHHGDCVGADADFHHLAKAAGSAVMIHPPSDPKLRAGLVGDDIAEEKPYLDRNRAIVHAATILVATPKESTPQGKGGTWFTIGYARLQGKRVTIVWPDGTTLIDGYRSSDDA